MAAKHKVWRFQRSMFGNVVSAMTHDRQWAMHFGLDDLWRQNFGHRLTFYAKADVVGPPSQPRLRLLKEVTERDWK